MNFTWFENCALFGVQFYLLTECNFIRIDGNFRKSGMEIVNDFLDFWPISHQYSNTFSND